MELWEQEFEWLRIRHFLKDALGKSEIPDLQTTLFLIGVQELGLLQTEFSKEEKQDLMHIAVCTLLSPDGYFEFVGKDQDGWPHWKTLKKVDIEGVEQQEQLLIQNIIKYFKAIYPELQLVESTDH